MLEVSIRNCGDGRDFISDSLQLFDVFVAAGRQRIALFDFAERLVHFHDEISRAGLLDCLEEGRRFVIELGNRLQGWILERALGRSDDLLGLDFFVRLRDDFVLDDVPKTENLSKIAQKAD